jgi:phosphoribosylformylglycinamidine cyclo-ligase
MNDEQRAADLINGWGKACEDIGATWGGGETPTLKNIVDPSTIDLAGSAVGIINPKERLVLGDKLTAGDCIVLIESSGIHANGITFVRSLAQNNSDIYKENLSDGRTFGEALLTPTHLYVSLVRDLMEAGLDLHYMVNITGHGWRKLMRATKSFSYVMREVPPAQAEFAFMQDKSGAETKEMYGNFNMGAGFAIYLPADQADQVIQIASDLGFKPLGITFSEDTLEVR